MLNDEFHIYGSPFTVLVSPSTAHAASCTAHGEGLSSAAPGQTADLIITSRDFFGNARDVGGDPFEVALAGPAVLRQLLDNNDGTYTCTYEVTASPEALTELAAVAGSELGAQPAVSGVLQIFCTMAGLPIQGSPFSPVLRLATIEQPPLSLDWAALPQHSDAVMNGGAEYESAIAAAAAYPSPLDVGNTPDLPPPAPPTARAALAPDPERVRQALELTWRSMA